MDIVAEATAHARAIYPTGDWPHIAEVVAYAKALAQGAGADEEIVTLAAYFHDISRATLGPAEHHVQSAALASPGYQRTIASCDGLLEMEAFRCLRGSEDAK